MITGVISCLLVSRRNFPHEYNPTPSSLADIKGKLRSQAGDYTANTFALGSWLPVIAIRSLFSWLIEQIISSDLLFLVLFVTHGFRSLGPH
jgi:hypothetical protein